MTKILAFLLHRWTISITAILLQIGILVLLIIYSQYIFVYSYILLWGLSFIVVIRILSSNKNPAFKLAWIIPILTFPIFGGIFYMLFGISKVSTKELKNIKSSNKNIMSYHQCNNAILNHLEELDAVGACHARYLQKYGGAPIWYNTTIKYFTLGEQKIAAMIEEIKNAKYYVFLQYFIIRSGEVWSSILDVLKQKVSEGVDVRVIYDDAGCAFTLPSGYHKRLAKLGIKAIVFNELRPFFNLRLNNRDHRKICVIDGHTAFTGGINLSDEYANLISVYGHWKDTAIMLKGAAVWNFTIFFLSTWDYLAGTNTDITQFYPDRFVPLPQSTDCFIQPFSDTPLDNECVGESIYLNMINKAQKYIYITTPYLIIDNEIQMALSLAAKNGVDIKIITPHMADKSYVHMVTRSYYEPLIAAGVKIYEYTPGFIHAKTCVCDDKYAVVGTINMDYRSLYFHFECAAFICGGTVIDDIKSDFLDTLAKSQEVSLAECMAKSPSIKLIYRILRIFAPLM